MKTAIVRLAVLVCLLVVQVSASENEFLIKPYLYFHPDHKIYLSWQYKDDIASGPVEIDFSDGARDLKLAAHFANGLYSLALPVPSCGFGTEVRYRVPGMLSAATIDDVPCAKSETADFALIADTQKHVNYVQELVKLIEHTPVTNVLITGDLVHVGVDYKMWLDFFEAMQPTIGHRVLVPVIGNHEYWTDNMAVNWKRFFRVPSEKDYFTTDIGNVRIFAINSNLETHPELTTPQAEWLEKELKATPKGMWKMVAMHHPPFSTDNVGLKIDKFHQQGYADTERLDDDEDDHLPPGPDKPVKLSKFLGSLRGSEFIELQKTFVPLFEKYKVDFVLAGHRHIYERSIKNGIQYVSAGPAGGTMSVPVVKNPFGVKVARERTITYFSATAKRMNVKTVTLTGAILDEFSIQK